MEHVVMFPFMAQGHLIPFLALAKEIEKRKRYTITIVNTPLNIQNLRSSLPLDTTINLAQLPFSTSLHSLPPHTENTDSLPTKLIINLFLASETLQPSFESLLSDICERDGRAPLCIIADVALGWTVQTAHKLGIFHAAYTTCGSLGTAAYFSLWLNLPHCLTESDEFHVPGFPETFRLCRSQLSSYLKAADGTDPWSRFFRGQLPLTFGSAGLLCNSVAEMEMTGVQVLQKITGLPVWSVGPLLPPPFSSVHSSSSMEIAYKHAGKEPSVSAKYCIEWLDLQTRGSVLYISFGSQNTILASQMMELAMGVEASNNPFIWVVRPPIGFNINDNFKAEWLPEGFQERVKERKVGLLVNKWAPQLEILAHKSTGAFLSHCGWNSVVESLSQGVPIIGWPLAAEQFYNSKMMEEELGVCVELWRGVGDGIRRHEVERVIGLVMGNEGKGAEMKKKAVGVGEIIKWAMKEEGEYTGSSLKALDDFLCTALSARVTTISASNQG